MTEETTNEFATEPVPDSATVGWFRVAMVAAMVSFSLPMFLTGLEISVIHSPSQTLLILIVGSLILTLIGCVTAAIGASTRLSSYMLNRVAFGRRGAALVNLAFAISLLGWFGVNIDLFSSAVLRLATDIFGYSLPVWPVELFAGIAMTVTTVFGFRAINILSMILTPVLIAVTAQLIAGSLEMTSVSELMAIHVNSGASFGDGVSAVVGAVIVGAVILPDITRFIRHWRGAVYVVLIAYFLVNLTVTIAGGLSATALGDDDLLNIMITLGIGFAAFAIVILGSWVLNSLNLYSTMLSVESTLPKLNPTVLVVVLGLLGTIAAFLDVLEHFLSFLFYLSIIFVPVAGVIIVDFLFVRRAAYHESRKVLEVSFRPAAVISWLVGAAVALVGSWGWISLSSIAAIDAMLVAGFTYFLLSYLAAKKKPTQKSAQSGGTIP